MEKLVYTGQISQLYAIKIHLFRAYYVSDAVGDKKTSDICDCLGRVGSLSPLKDTTIHKKNQPSMGQVL